MPVQDLSPHSLSSDESAFLVPPPLPVEPEIVSVVVQTQRALKQVCLLLLPSRQSPETWQSVEQYFASCACR